MKVLIVKTSSMGDVIHTLPALTDAVRALPDIKFDWVVEEDFAEIPKWHDAVDSVIPVAIRRWRKHPIKAMQSGEWRNFYKQLRSERYDFIIDAQGLFKSALLTRLARGTRCGLDKKSARETLASFAYQKKIFIPKNQHAITRIRQLFAKILDYAVPNCFSDYGINRGLVDVGRENRAPTADRFLVFIHGSARKEKCWAEENWIKLVKLAGDSSYKVKLPWGNDEEFHRACRIAEQCDNAEVLPKLSLTEFAKILQQAKGAVAVDTGLGHLAAALGVPCVSLYGPTDPKLVGTCGKNASHICDAVLKNIPTNFVWKRLAL